MSAPADAYTAAGAARRTLADLRQARLEVAELRGLVAEMRRESVRAHILLGIVRAQSDEIEALRAIAGGVWAPEVGE